MGSTDRCSGGSRCGLEVGVGVGDEDEMGALTNLEQFIYPDKRSQTLN